MRIAVDAVGGDHGPEVIIDGVVAGARRFGVGLLLAGPEDEVRRSLAKVDTAGLDIEVRDAPDLIAMDESPAQAVRRKPRYGIAVALEAVRSGAAGGMVSAGNSGAVMASALVQLGRIPGVDRPAIASPLPSVRGYSLVLDLGAVTDPRPQSLVQFAQMGAVYAERVMGIAHPTVGLLSNGEEATKGNALVQEAHALLAAAPGINFHGNVEGRDIPRGVVDVVVTDGFTGNVALKIAEGAASLVAEVIREELTASLVTKLAAAVLRPAFARAKKRIDYAETGGALLLGTNGVVVIAHGRSNVVAMENAIGVASRACQSQITEAIAAALRDLRNAAA
ncbi:MAG: phosphate acyltransferase PlsX [Chloroflexota bacterium]